MSNRVLQIFLITLIFPFLLKAQVKGTITDTLNYPVPFANVLLVKANDTTLIRGVLTDDTGNFAIEITDTGSVRLVVYMVGYEKYIGPAFYVERNSPVKNLEPITLKASIAMMNQVEVVAIRPLIERKTDMTVLNVENSILSAGNNALDILKRAPGVTVDKDDKVNLNGKLGVMIWINGKPSYLAAEDVAKMLRNMSSSQIEKIEIISNPSAKYDAAGNAGIINIVLKKNKALGLNGQITGGYGQGIYDKENAGINMNYRTPKWNFFGSYNYNRYRGFYRFDVKRNYLGSNTTILSSVNQEAKNLYTEETNSAKAGFDFNPNDRHSFGVFINGIYAPQRIKYNTNTTVTDNTIPAITNVNTMGTANTNWVNGGANVNYTFKIDTSGKQISANADYLLFNSAMDQLYNTNYVNTSSGIHTWNILKSHLPSNIDIKSVKVDYVNPIADKSKLDIGVKSSLVNSDNNAMYWNVVNGTEVVDSTKSNHFNYKENINAAYINFSNTISDKFSFQLGLRGEQTIAKGIQYTTDTSFSRNYFRLFPSGFFHWKANEKNEFNLSYSRRIDRPSYQDLNPFLFFMDPYTFMQGNILLNPQYTNSMELSHTFNSNINTTLYYSNTDKPMLQVAQQDITTKAITYTSLNMSSLNSYGASLSFQTSPTKWWSNSNSIQGYYNVYAGNIQGENINNGKATVMVNIQNSFLLKRDYKAELNVYYVSPQVYGVFVFKPISSLSFGIQKMIFKEKGTIKLAVSDLLWKERSRGTVENSFAFAQINNYHDSRVVNLTVSYRFGRSTTAYEERTNKADETNRVKDRKE